MHLANLIIVSLERLIKRYLLTLNARVVVGKWSEADAPTQSGSRLFCEFKKEGKLVSNNHNRMQKCTRKCVDMQV